MRQDSSLAPSGVEKTRVRVARVRLLVKSHSLPELSYLVPEDLSGEVRVGSVASALLSGRSRTGVVVGTEAEEDPRARERIRSVADFSLTPDTVVLCERIAALACVPVASVLAAALPPGIVSDRYEISATISGVSWHVGDMVSRRALKLALGDEGFKAAESAGDITHRPALSEPQKVEFVALKRTDDGTAPDGSSLERAPSQKKMLDHISASGGEISTAELLSTGGFRRDTLRTLVSRGFVRLEERRPLGGVSVCEGELPKTTGDTPRYEGRVEGGIMARRVPTDAMAKTATDFAVGVVASGRSALVLVPRVAMIDEIRAALLKALPAGRRVGVYHAGVGSERGRIWEMAGAGDLDVLIGTRSAALTPLGGVGGICVVGESDPAHRAPAGHEGIPLHVREIVIERFRLEGQPLLFLSPHPSLRLHASVEAGKATELPEIRHERWPLLRLVDMRASGAVLSGALLDTCRRAVERGGSVAVMTGGRAGVNQAHRCAGCGRTRSCKACGAEPSPVSGWEEGSRCPACGHPDEGCPACGSHRVLASGLTPARLAEKIAAKIGCRAVAPDSPLPPDIHSTPGVVVGRYSELSERVWDVVAIPDADSLLARGQMSGTERAFRTLFGAAESARSLVVQTRNPENPTLRAAVRGDYRAFARNELPRLRSLGYPPFGHVARILLTGPRSGVLRAVEFSASTAEIARPGLDVIGPVPQRNPDGEPGWIVILKSPDRLAVVSAAARIAQTVSKHAPRRVRATVEIDPEEI